MFRMLPDEFRRRGKETIDWIADYLERVEEYPVLAQVKPGEIRSMLPEHPPATGEDFDRVVADLDEVILPGMTHWQSPGFFAVFQCQRFWTGDSGGTGVLRTRSSGHAVGDESRLYGA